VSSRSVSSSGDLILIFVTVIIILTIMCYYSTSILIWRWRIGLAVTALHTLIKTVMLCSVSTEVGDNLQLYCLGSYQSARQTQPSTLRGMGNAKGQGVVLFGWAGN